MARRRLLSLERGGLATAYEINRPSAPPGSFDASSAAARACDARRPWARCIPDELQMESSID